MSYYLYTWLCFTRMFSILVPLVSRLPRSPCSRSPPRRLLPRLLRWVPLWGAHGYFLSHAGTEQAGFDSVHFPCPRDCVSRISHTFETGESPLEPRTLENRNLPFLLQSLAMTSTAASLRRLSYWETFSASGTRSPPRGFRFYIRGVYHNVTSPVFPVGSRHLVSVRWRASQVIHCFGLLDGCP